MELELFRKVNKTAELLEENIVWYSTIENKLVDYFNSICADSEDYIGYYSRIKETKSFKNKIVNNKYYLKYDTSQEIIDNMVDIIGITLECRFKYDEEKIYQILINNFSETEEGVYQSNENDKIYLDLNEQQPQQEQNGFYNYRIDGFYNDNGTRINFELQIRSLVNTFWSGVEHQVIYKNNNYILNDYFMKEMLLSVKKSLDALDFQLSNIYKQMKRDNQESYGLYEQSMKGFLAKTIHDLYSAKLKEMTDLELNIKQTSAIISHFIYVCDFLRSDTPDQIMISYLERVSNLINEEIDFSHNVVINKGQEHPDIFVDKLSNHFIEIINEDYDWHILFVMIFSLQMRDPLESIYEFAGFIKELLINPTWFDSTLDRYSLDYIKNDIYLEVVEALIEVNDIHMTHEGFLYQVMLTIRRFMDELVIEIEHNDQYYINNKDDVLKKLRLEIIECENKE